MKAPLWFLAANLAACLSTQMQNMFLNNEDAQSVGLQTEYGHRDETVKVFVAIMSSSVNSARRDALRVATSGSIWPDATVMKFVVCKSHNATFQAQLDQEKDMLFVNCDAKTGPAATVRILELLELFVSDYGTRDVLVVAEETSFVAWRRLRSLMVLQRMDLQGGAYMGLPLPPGPLLDEDGKISKDGSETLPGYMENSLVVLGRGVVKHILESKFASQHILPQWDQAVGLWVDDARSRGTHIHSMTLPGLSASGGLYAGCGQTWNDFPYLWVPHMGDKDMMCMTKADDTGNQTHVFGECLSDCNRIR